MEREPKEAPKPEWDKAGMSEVPGQGQPRSQQLQPQELARLKGGHPFPYRALADKEYLADLSKRLHLQPATNVEQLLAQLPPLTQEEMSQYHFTAAQIRQIVERDRR